MLNMREKFLIVENALSVDKCCGSQNLDFNNNLACIKCRCQYLQDVSDSSKFEKI